MIVKLHPIVSNDCPRDAEPSNDVPPHETLNVPVCDGGEQLSLYPFREVVHPNYDKSLLPRGQGKGSGIVY